MKTLKQRYDLDADQQRKQRIARLDERKLARAASHELIVEAFDQNTANQAIDLIKKLNSLKWPTANNGSADPFALFRNATKNAVAELQRAMAGQGRQKGLFDKLIGLFKQEKDNPFVDVVAYINAVQSFFAVMKNFADSMGGNDDDTLSTIVGGSAQPGGAGDEVAVKQLKAIIVKGLKPEGGIATKLGTTWAKKYLKGLNIDSFAGGIAQMTKKQLTDIANLVSQQLSNAPDIASRTAAAEQAATQGKAPQSAPESTSSTQAEKGQTSQPEQGSQPAVTPVVKPGRQNDLIAKVTTKVKPALEDLGVKNVDKVIAALEDMGVLKEPS